LNDENELLEEQTMLKEKANLIGGKNKDTSDFQKLIAQKEWEYKHKTHSMDEEDYDDLKDFGYPDSEDKKD